MKNGTDFVTHKEGKPMLSYLPWKALGEVAKVLEHGATKKSQSPYDQVPDHEHLSALLRHAVERIEGGEGAREADTGLHSLAFVTARALLLLERELVKEERPAAESCQYQKCPVPAACRVMARCVCQKIRC